MLNWTRQRQREVSDMMQAGEGVRGQGNGSAREATCYRPGRGGRITLEFDAERITATSRIAKPKPETEQEEVAALRPPHPLCACSGNLNVPPTWP